MTKIKRIIIMLLAICMMVTSVPLYSNAGTSVINPNDNPPTNDTGPINRDHMEYDPNFSLQEGAQTDGIVIGLGICNNETYEGEGDLFTWVEDYTTRYYVPIEGNSYHYVGHPFAALTTNLLDSSTKATGAIEEILIAAVNDTDNEYLVGDGDNRKRINPDKIEELMDMLGPLNPDLYDRWRRGDNKHPVVIVMEMANYSKFKGNVFKGTVADLYSSVKGGDIRQINFTGTDPYTNTAGEGGHTQHSTTAALIHAGTTADDFGGGDKIYSNVPYQSAYQAFFGLNPLSNPPAERDVRGVRGKLASALRSGFDDMTGVYAVAIDAPDDIPGGKTPFLQGEFTWHINADKIPETPEGYNEDGVADVGKGATSVTDNFKFGYIDVKNFTADTWRRYFEEYGHKDLNIKLTVKHTANFGPNTEGFTTSRETILSGNKFGFPDIISGGDNNFESVYIVKVPSRTFVEWLTHGSLGEFPLGDGDDIADGTLRGEMLGGSLDVAFACELEVEVPGYGRGYGNSGDWVKFNNTQVHYARYTFEDLDRFYWTAQSEIEGWSQLKHKGIGQAEFEARTGVPTTEDLFISMGGSQYIVSLAYKYVQADYVREYKIKTKDKYPNFLYYHAGNKSEKGYNVNRKSREYKGVITHTADKEPSNLDKALSNNLSSVTASLKTNLEAVRSNIERQVKNTFGKIDHNATESGDNVTKHSYNDYDVIITDSRIAELVLSDAENINFLQYVKGSSNAEIKNTVDALKKLNKLYNKISNLVNGSKTLRSASAVRNYIKSLNDDDNDGINITMFKTKEKAPDLDSSASGSVVNKFKIGTTQKVKPIATPYENTPFMYQEQYVDDIEGIQKPGDVDKALEVISKSDEDFLCLHDSPDPLTVSTLEEPTEQQLCKYFANSKPNYTCDLHYPASISTAANTNPTAILKCTADGQTSDYVDYSKGELTYCKHYEITQEGSRGYFNPTPYTRQLDHSTNLMFESVYDYSVAYTGGVIYSDNIAYDKDDDMLGKYLSYDYTIQQKFRDVKYIDIVKASVWRLAGGVVLHKGGLDGLIVPYAPTQDGASMPEIFEIMVKNRGAQFLNIVHEDETEDYWSEDIENAKGEDIGEGWTRKEGARSVDGHIKEGTPHNSLDSLGRLANSYSLKSREDLLPNPMSGHEHGFEVKLLSDSDGLEFIYDIAKQGGRSHVTFPAFLKQALALSFYTKDDEKSAARNYLLVQSDFLSIGGENGDLTTFVGFNYATRDYDKRDSATDEDAQHGLTQAIFATSKSSGDTGIAAYISGNGKYYKKIDKDGRTSATTDNDKSSEALNGIGITKGTMSCNGNVDNNMQELDKSLIKYLENEGNVELEYNADYAKFTKETVNTQAGTPSPTLANLATENKTLGDTLIPANLIPKVGYVGLEDSFEDKHQHEPTEHKTRFKVDQQPITGGINGITFDYYGKNVLPTEIVKIPGGAVGTSWSDSSIPSYRISATSFFPYVTGLNTIRWKSNNMYGGYDTALVYNQIIAINNAASGLTDIDKNIKTKLNNPGVFKQYVSGITKDFMDAAAVTAVDKSKDPISSGSSLIVPVGYGGYGDSKTNSIVIFNPSAAENVSIATVPEDLSDGKSLYSEDTNKQLKGWGVRDQRVELVLAGDGEKDTYMSYMDLKEEHLKTGEKQLIYKLLAESKKDTEFYLFEEDYPSSETELEITTVQGGTSYKIEKSGNYTLSVFNQNDHEATVDLKLDWGDTIHNNNQVILLEKRNDSDPKVTFKEVQDAARVYYQTIDETSNEAQEKEDNQKVETFLNSSEYLIMYLERATKADTIDNYELVDLIVEYNNFVKEYKKAFLQYTDMGNGSIVFHTDSIDMYSAEAVQALNNINSRLEIVRSTLSDFIGRINGGLEAILAEVVTVDNSAALAKVQECSVSVNNLETELKTLTATRNEKQKELNKKNDEINAFNSAITTYNQLVSGLSTQKDTAQEELDTIKALENTDEAKALKADLDALEVELNTLTSQYNQATQALTAATSAYNSAVTDYNSAVVNAKNELADTAEDSLVDNAVEAALEEADAIDNAKAEISDETKKGLVDTAIEASLDDSPDKETHVNAAKDAISDASKKTLIDTAIDKAKSAKSSKDSAIGGIKEKGNKTLIQTAINKALDMRLKELDKDAAQEAVDTKESEVNAKQTEVNAKQLEYNTYIRKDDRIALENTISTIDTQISTGNTVVEGLRTRVDDIEDETEILTTEISKLDATIVTKNRDLVAAVADLQEAQDILDSLESEYSRHDEVIDLINNILAAQTFEELPKVNATIDGGLVGSNITDAGVLMQTGGVLTFNLQSLELKKSGVIKLTLPTNLNINGNAVTVTLNSSGVMDRDYKLHKVSNGTILDIYIEAYNDIGLSDLTIKFNTDVHILPLGQDDSYITLEKVFIMYPGSGTQQSIEVGSTTFDFLYDSGSAYNSTGTVARTYNRNLFDSMGSTVDVVTNVNVQSGLLYLLREKNKPITVSENALSNPHKVYNANWRYYVLGWSTDEGHIIRSPYDRLLSIDSTVIQWPAGGEITVGELKDEACLVKWNGQVYLTTKDAGMQHKILEIGKKVSRYDYITFSNTLDVSTYALIQEADYTLKQGERFGTYPLRWWNNSTDKVNFLKGDFYEFFFDLEDSDKFLFDVKYCLNYEYRFLRSDTRTLFYGTEEHWKADWEIIEEDAKSQAKFEIVGNVKYGEEISSSYVSLDDVFSVYFDNVGKFPGGPEEKDANVSNQDNLGAGYDISGTAILDYDTGISNWYVDAYNQDKTTETTGWIYAKYLVFNKDVYVFKSPGGEVNPTYMPSYREINRVTENDVQLIKAGEKVFLGTYAPERKEPNKPGESDAADNTAEFRDFGDPKVTKDPHGRPFLYHFWLPLSAGEGAGPSGLKVEFHTVNINGVSGNIENFASLPGSIGDSATNFEYNNVDRKEAAYSTRIADIVGRIGALTIVDTGDPRFSDSFKRAKDTDEYIIYPLVKKIKQFSNKSNEHGSQLAISLDPFDVRGRIGSQDLLNMVKGKLKGSGLNYDNYNVYTEVGNNTYSTQWFKNGLVKWNYKVNEQDNFASVLPLSGEFNQHETLRDQPLKLGYELYLSLETIGSYTSESRRSNIEIDGEKVESEEVNGNGDEGNNKIQIRPFYSAVSGKLKSGQSYEGPVDVYMRVGDNYVMINNGCDRLTKSEVGGDDENSDCSCLFPNHTIGDMLLTMHSNYNPSYITPNTEKPDKDGNIVLDQNLLRRMVTEEESEVTKDVLEEIPVYKSLLMYFGTESKDIGGNPLDPKWSYGNSQLLFLRDYNMSFIGGKSAGIRRLNDETEGSSIQTKKNAQKYYFGLGLPSSSIFVPHGWEFKTENMLKSGYIVVSIDVIARGDVWNLHYMSDVSKMSFNVEGTPLEWSEWNAYYKKYPWLIPVTYYNIEKTSVSDLDTQGSH